MSDRVARARFVRSCHSSVAIAIPAPKHIAKLGFAVLHPRYHEQQIGKTIEVLARGIAHRFGLREPHQRALRTPAHGTRNMREARRTGSAGEDEFLERREVLVEALAGGAEPQHMLVGPRDVSRYRQFTAHIEQ